MVRKAGYNPIKFDDIKEELFEQYISAVQMAALKDYQPMTDLISMIFPV